MTKAIPQHPEISKTLMLTQNYHCIMTNRNGEENFTKINLNCITSKLCGEICLFLHFLLKKWVLSIFVISFFLIVLVTNYVLHDNFPEKLNSLLINVDFDIVWQTSSLNLIVHVHY